jgi:predicted oxidoreductase
MNHVFHDLTDHEQPSNVIDFDDRRELDIIKGNLAPLCATMNITPATLLMAAQHVQNALHAKQPEVDAYANGVAYAKDRQIDQAFRDLENAKQAKRISDAVRRPLTVEGELEAAFGPEVA